MNLLLTSAGMRLKKEIEDFVADVKPPARVLHVLTAAKREKIVDYVHKDVTTMKELGWRVVDIDLEEKTETELREILKNVDVVYVQGGNTFYLIDAIRKSNFEKVLREFLTAGGLYIGVSAGTLVACKSIQFAEGADPNELGITDYSGMGLVDLVIDVHRENGSSDGGVVKLTDDQAVLVQDEKIEIIEKKII